MTVTEEVREAEWLKESRGLNPDCGCQQRGDRMFSCSYHEGAQDAFSVAYQLGVEAAHEENDKEMADWVCPCCSWPNCRHEHPTDVKRILQRAIRNLKG